jgi:hypothetical protein
MFDWTTVLVGVGTSLIATGISGLLKTAYIHVKSQKLQRSLKKSTNQTYVERKKISSVELKKSPLFNPENRPYCPPTHFKKNLNIVTTVTLDMFFPSFTFYLCITPKSQ